MKMKGTIMVGMWLVFVLNTDARYNPPKKLRIGQGNRNTPKVVHNSSSLVFILFYIFVYITHVLLEDVGIYMYVCVCILVFSNSQVSTIPLHTP